MNEVHIIGRFVREPEIRYSQGENPMCVASFTIAVNRPKKKADEKEVADFIKCKAFGKIGENVERFCHQGDKVALNGTIQTGSYTNKDGKKVNTTEVVAQSFLEFLEMRSQSQNYDQDSADLIQSGYQTDSMPQKRESRYPVDSMSQKEEWYKGRPHETEGQIMNERKRRDAEDAANGIPQPTRRREHPGQSAQSQNPVQNFDFMNIPDGYDGLPFN